MSVENRRAALPKQKDWADYYCFLCQTFALQGGLAVWCGFFNGWMHVDCHKQTNDREHQRSAAECYEQQVLPATE